ncbi:MAG: hypothetical protein U0559_04140 [Anaerolineae bacterium]
MDTATRRPTSYLVSVWSERAADGVTVWRGVLITAAGQRLHFSTLTQLSHWLGELAGWQEPRQNGESALPR